MRDLPRKTDPYVDFPDSLPPPNRRPWGSEEASEIRMRLPSIVLPTRPATTPLAAPALRRPHEYGSTPAMAATRPHVIAISTTNPEVAHSIQKLAAGASSGTSPLVVKTSDAVSFADVIVIDDVARIAELRAEARTDAAVVFVFTETAPTESVQAAHAAGAFACIRFPFVGQELLGIVKSAVDATTAKVRVADLAKQLDLQQHLASIGRMSSGLTHEIANPLSVAMGALQFIRQEVAHLIESERLLRTISTLPATEIERGLHAARAHLASTDHDRNELISAMDDTSTSYQRIEALLKNLRVLIGQGVVKVKTIDAGSIVRDVRRWAAEALRGVTVEEEGACGRASPASHREGSPRSGAGPLYVRADANLLGQIVLNLATNAALAAKTLSAPRVRFHVYASGPKDVVISIRDNGPGIPEDVQDKIFEPFFTTRRGRGGTGLGLSLSRELARQIGAEISFWSVLGRGTCFRVRLPRVDAPPRDSQIPLPLHRRPTPTK